MTAVFHFLPGGRQGAQAAAFEGPNIETIGMSTAAAIWATPLSLLTSRSQVRSKAPKRLQRRPAGEIQRAVAGDVGPQFDLVRTANDDDVGRKLLT